MPRSLLIAAGLFLAIQAALALSAYRPWAVYERDIHSDFERSGTLQFSRNGRELIWNPRHIICLDSHSGSGLSHFGDEITNATLLPDGKTLIARGHNKLEAWDYLSGKRHWEVAIDSSEGWSLAVSPDGKALAWRAWDPATLESKSVRVVPLNLQSVAAPLDLQNAVSLDSQYGVVSLAFVPPGDKIAVLKSSGELSVFDIKSKARVAAISLGTTHQSWGARTPLLILDDTNLLAGTSIVSTKEWLVERELPNPATGRTNVTCAASHGSLIYVGTDEGKMYRVNWRTREVSRLHSAVTAGGVASIDISPDGQQLVTAAYRRSSGDGWFAVKIFSLAPVIDGNIHFWRIPDASHE